jgi:DNA polymerase III delta prime subunit
MTKFDQRGQQVSGDQYNIGRDFNIFQFIAPLSLSEVQLQNARAKILKRVRSFWITGILDHSLHDAALITLGLQQQSDLVANSWSLVALEKEQLIHPLPSDTSIVKAYYDADGELLILGTPGAGKTTLLLDLARHLLDCAEQDNAHPIPAIFNLSSWTLKRQPIVQWLIEELKRHYRVPEKLAQLWVNSDHVFPLLDGLDEVPLTHRAACIEAINIYRREHGLVPTVVCSRNAEYASQKTYLLLRRAVIIRPLTTRQIDDYLSNTDKQLDAIHVALQTDPILQELATTPLMLNILIYTYQGKSVEDFGVVKSLTARRQQLFADYVKRMLLRPPGEIEPSYSKRQIMHWLSWLAQQKVLHSQSIFYLEGIQPDWLPGTWLYTLYLILLLTPITTLFLGLPCGLIFGLLYGLPVGLLCTAFIGVGFGLWLGFVDWRPEEKLKVTIKPAAVIGWSWRQFWRQLGRGAGILLVVLPLGLCAGGSMGLIFGPIIGWLGALFFLVILGAFLGSSNEMLDKRIHFKPNQEIWLSMRNGSVIGLFYGLISGVYFWWAVSPPWGLGIGLGIGLILWLFRGGFAWYAHFTLRLLLWRAGCMPWNYSRFLDYAARRILLQKVGGGYKFFHGLLQEYLASLNTTLIP